MDITKETLQEVARVARLKLTDEEIDQFLPEVEECLKAFSALEEIDTKDVEPQFHPIPFDNVLRDDEEKPCLSQEQALSLSKHTKDGYFMGPRAV